MPRIITWWITPGASNLASLGIVEFLINVYAHVNYLFMDVGAADKAAIQRVKVPPYQLLVSDT